MSGLVVVAVVSVRMRRVIHTLRFESIDERFGGGQCDDVEMGSRKVCVGCDARGVVR